MYALDVLGLSMAEAAEAAGYSGGRSDSSEDRHRQFQAAASRAKSTKRVSRLRKAFRQYREHGDDSPIASEREILAHLTRVLRTSSDSVAINAAARLLDYHRRESVADRAMSKEQLAELLVARYGVDKARQIFGLFGLPLSLIQTKQAREIRVG